MLWARKVRPIALCQSLEKVGTVVTGDAKVSLDLSRRADARALHAGVRRDEIGYFFACRAVHLGPQQANARGNLRDETGARRARGLSSLRWVGGQQGA